MTEATVAREADVTKAPQSRPLRRSEAATYVTNNYFPCSPKTLAKLCVIGGGPAYRKAGRVPVYETADLDAWAHAKIA
jgi:hypothetical protein